MFLCFETDDKRAAYPEASLVAMDENGFTLKSMYSARNGDTTFIKLSAFQGVVQHFSQAMSYVKRTPAKQAAKPAPLPNNPTF